MENVMINLPVKEAMQLIALLSLGGYAVFTAVMYYHWNAYSTDDTVTRITYATYFATTTPLLLTMLAIAYLTT